MSETIPLDLDPALRKRVLRVAGVRDWDEASTLTHMIQRGLVACEHELATSLDEAETQALQSAVDAMQQVSDDSGFGWIGRTGGDVGASASSDADASNTDAST